MKTIATFKIAMKPFPKEHNCDNELRASDWALSGRRQTGDKWTCSCGVEFVHVCDEAEGCYWIPTEPQMARTGYCADSWIQEILTNDD